MFLHNFLYGSSSQQQQQQQQPAASSATVMPMPDECSSGRATFHRKSTKETQAKHKTPLKLRAPNCLSSLLESTCGSSIQNDIMDTKYKYFGYSKYVFWIFKICIFILKIGTLDAQNMYVGYSKYVFCILNISILDTQTMYFDIQYRPA